MEVASVIQPSEDGMTTINASIGSDGQDTWVAWEERSGGSRPNRIVAQRLDAVGMPMGSPVFLDGSGHATAPPRVSVAPFGLAVSWPELGHVDAFARNEFGHSRLAIAVLPRNALVATVTRLATTGIDSARIAPGVPIDAPSGWLFTWVGAPTDHGLDVAWLAHLDCVEGQ
jgi:hypothetical protein